MIELPQNAPRATTQRVMDYTVTQGAGGGGPTNRIARPGSRFAVQYSVGPLIVEAAREWVSLLIAAKSSAQLVKIPFPLLKPQGPPGSPVVDGVNQEGTSLNVRGFAAGYAARPNTFFSIEDADGSHYLHNVQSGARAASDGTATLTINPPIRYASMPDGTSLHFGKPYVTGYVQGEEWSWQHNADRLIPIQFTVEELK